MFLEFLILQVCFKTLFHICCI